MQKASSQRYFIYILALLVLILAVVGIYFKKILNKPIPGIGGILIPNVHAQSTSIVKNKEKLMSYEDLNLDKLSFRSHLDLSGFKVLPTTSEPPDSCIQMNLFSTRLALILFDEKNIPEAWKKYIEKCSFEFNKDLSAILEIKNLNLKDIESLKKFLTPYKFKRSKMDFILDVYERKKRNLVQSKEVELFINITNELKKNRSEKDIYFQVENLRKMNITNEFIKNLIDLNFALKIKNTSWAKSIVTNLIHFNKIRYINAIQGEYFKDEKTKADFKEAIVELIKLAHGTLSDKELVAILVNTISDIWNDEKIEELKGDISANWSLAEIREKASSITYGRKFPSFWYNKLLQRTTKTELNEFLKRNLKERNIQIMPIHSFGIFRNYFPSSKEKREIIIEKILSSPKKDCYHKDIISYLLENDVLKRTLSEKDSHYAGASFNIKRRHHRDCLENGLAINYHLYNLIKLGDKDDKLLWWFVL